MGVSLCEQMKVTALGLTSSQEFLKAAACVLATVSASLTDSGGTGSLGNDESLKSCCLLTILDDIVAASKRLRRNDAYREQSAGGRS
jgi:hypothetical protein